MQIGLVSAWAESGHTLATAIFTLAPSSTIDTATLSRLPAELTDMLVRESALDMAHRKLAEARTEVLNDKVRLEAKTGLLKGFSAKGSMDRETALKTVFSQKLHYDSQIKKAQSLTALLAKETGRWLECYLKTGSPEYAAALAPHDYAEDWSRFSYNFELLIKSFQMGLQDITVQYKRENPTGAPSQLRKDSIRKLQPIARQIEIDVEFFNRILTYQARQKGRKATLHPEYSWGETTEQLALQTVETALGTVHELLAACAGFLTNLGHVINREKQAAEEKAARGLQPPASYLKGWWEGIRPVAALRVEEEKLAAIITETETMIMDGEFSARFNRHMVETMPASEGQAAPEKPATTAPMSVSPQSDAELRALKARLQAELEETAKVKAGLAARERTLRDNEQALRDNEQRFAEKCQREQAALEAMKAGLAMREEEIVIKARQAAETQAEELARLEEMKAELAARSAFIEESEQRLLNKGQEQLEGLAELEQKEEELMTTKRELNAMRKEMGLPMIPLRAKPVDEFEE